MKLTENKALCSQRLPAGRQALPSTINYKGGSDVNKLF